MAADGSGSRDLQATLALSPEEARTGTVRTLTLPGGRQLSVSIPPGVRTGHTIRLEGQYPSTTSYAPPSALVLTISVTTPENIGPSNGNDALLATELIKTPPPPPPPSSYMSTPTPYPTQAASQNPYAPSAQIFHQQSTSQSYYQQPEPTQYASPYRAP